MVRRERLFADGEHAPQGLLGARVSAHRRMHRGEAGQDRSDFRMVIASRAFDFEQLLQQRLRLSEFAAAQIRAGEATQHGGDLRMTTAEAVVRQRKRALQKRLAGGHVATAYRDRREAAQYVNALRGTVLLLVEIERAEQ